MTEIYDYLRLLFARAGTPTCPDHDLPLEAQTVAQMVDQVLALPEGSRLMLLAPVVADRKGEHVQLMGDLQAQGFIRARIDGEIYELDQPPALDLRKKHTIEAIVDRFKVKEDLRLRLAESFETALRLADGSARIAFMDADDPNSAEEIVFSDRFACNQCGYSLTELEPRLFSFNNPTGACPTCDGLGVKQFFDPARVVVNPDLSLAGGAIRGWDRKTTYYYQMVKSLASHYEFDIETPFEELSAKLQKVVLYGSGNEKIDFFYENTRGMQIKKLHRFEGVLPNLERRYHETESNAVREELTKFLNSQNCPDCGGTRLNRSARHVFVCEKSLPEISNLSVGHAREFFDVDASRWLARSSRRQNRQRNRRSSRLLVGRRTRLSFSRSLCRYVVRRRSTAHSTCEPDRLGIGRRDVHPRRTLDRPAPARQQAPVEHLDSPA